MTYNVKLFGAVESTQDIAHEMIRDGSARDRTIIAAERQTKGRGRGGHAWVSEPGNLYSTFIFESAPSPADAYIFAIAVTEAIRDLGIHTEIKWSNDVLVRGNKISGILIEYLDGFLIAGIGVNIKHSPDNVSYPTTNLAAHGVDMDAEKLMHRLIKRIDFWRDENFDTIRKRWMELALKDKGYVGIHDDGGLILQTDNGLELVYSVGR